MTNSLVSLSPDSQLLLGQEMRAAAGVRSPEDLFILLPAPQQLSTAFRQMISAFNWTFLVLLDRRPEPETPNIASYYSTLGGFFLSQLYHNYNKNISIIVTDME